MSRLKGLLQNTTQEKAEAQPVSVRSIGGATIDFTSPFTQGPFTEADYDVYSVKCAGEDCESFIIHCADPEYNLTVGYSSSFPLELLFSTIEGTIEDGAQKFWGRHELALDKRYVCTCPECGHENSYAVCRDGGLILPSDHYVTSSRPIPKNRLRFLTVPKEEWETAAS